MKQVLNINLGGQTITIHVDAYNYLCSYLDTIEKPIKNAEVAEKVLSDYESKMAKLWTEQKESNSIVTKDDVRTAIDTLGSPEIPISALYEDEEEILEFNSTTKKRRLFRDADNKRIGGVASGLAAYLGIHDPVWVRVAFIGATLAGFASIPIYLILWVAMPLASTKSDRDAMYGEKLDLSNTADRVAVHLDHLSEGIRGKFGSRASSF